MSKEKKDALRFDPGKLEDMQEPLTVRVEKIRGSARTPIDLPPREEGDAPGMMWDKNSVRRIESWLVNDWSGGGIYRILIVDKNGERMEWEAVYDPRNFPERIPPTMNAVIPGSSSNNGPSPPPPPIQQQTAAQVSMPQGHWPPHASAYQPIQMLGANGSLGGPPMAPPMPPTQWTQPPWERQSWAPTWSPPPRVAPPTPAAHSDEPERFRRHRPTAEEDFERKRLEDQARQLQEQVQRLERDRLEVEHKASLERVQQTHAQQMAALQDEVRRITERATQVPVPDPALSQLREERDALNRQREQMERDRLEAERRATERAERANAEEKVNRRFEEMMAVVAKLAETPKQTGPDPTLLALQEQIRRQEEEMRRNVERAEREKERLLSERQREQDRIEQERRERDRLEADRREREALKEEARRREEETRRLIDEMKSSQNKGPDPLIEYMRESSRQQIEAMKDLARQQQDAANRMQGFMMPPRDIISMVKDSSNGMDTLQRNVMGIYNDIFQTQRGLIEQAAQLNGGGGDPASVRLLEQGISRAAEFAERYVSAKRDEAVSQAKVQQTAAEAQSRAWQAQQAAAAAQVAHAQAAQQHQHEAPHAQAQGGGLGGTDPEAAKPRKAKRPKEAKPTPAQAPMPENVKRQAATDDGTTDPETGATIAKVIQLRPLGHSDEEWFGVALDQVKKLRAGVAEFLDAVQADPPRVDPKTGQIAGLSPEQTVMLIVRAVNYGITQNVDVRAFRQLFVSEQFADFMDVLLPDAHIQYRADCVSILAEIAKQSREEAKNNEDPQVEDVEDPEEEDDEDDDEDEDDEDEYGEDDE